MKKQLKTAMVLVIACTFWLTHVHQVHPQSSLSPPVYSGPLKLSLDQLWSLVNEILVELHFEIETYDQGSQRRLKVTAIGRPKHVKVGLGTKREREKISIEIEELREGVYECFANLDVLEFWPVYSKWTVKPTNLITSDTRNSFGEHLRSKLRPHSNTIRK